MCQERSPADDRRDVAMPGFVPLVVRADTLARQLDRLPGIHPLPSATGRQECRELDRMFGKLVPMRSQSKTATSIVISLFILVFKVVQQTM